MKVHFLSRFSATAIIFALLPACYSVEFYPVAEYPNLRRDDIDEVEIRTSAPRKPYRRLGHLVVKDAAADLESRNFRRFLKSQAREHGAEGAWLVRRGRYNNAVVTGSPTDARYSQSIETGQLDLETGVLTLVLFNYISESDSDGRAEAETGGP
ncbi:MAG: hypothetical protein RIF32_14765 [Leptospirales bacterium]|jgi:hypothetical protein